MITSSSLSTFSFIYTDGILYGFGNNDYGALGLDTFEDVFVPTICWKDDEIKALSCGRQHTLLLRNNGELYSCGDNTNGALGIGSFVNSGTFQHVMTDKEIKWIGASNSTSIIYKNNGDLFLAGTNIFKTGNTNSFKLILNDKNITKMCVGGDVIAFYYEKEKELKLCGRNFVSQLKFKVEDLVSICGGNLHFLYLTKSGEVYGLGGSFSNLGIGFKKTPKLIMKDPQIISICCGGNHNAIYKRNGDLFVFGNNIFGQLGINSKERKETPTLLLNDPNIKSISMGFVHSMIYKYNGDLLVFGYNKDGRLGLGEDLPLQLTPTLLKNYRNISILHNAVLIFNWKIDLHLSLPKSFRFSVFCFVSSLKLQKRNLPKLPKFVLWSVLEHLGSNSFPNSLVFKQFLIYQL
eukprot:TRINITY_DN1451_c1_g3_i1.p1 TRINITY_DN1451_c1_g3~~TRINITY_DN1451_c1_g3_i1.p1  ORF type:complete len:406 (-),score=90.61 TRINITY_DN1451_c1_g3_i1:1221-2438(-)